MDGLSVVKKTTICSSGESSFYFFGLQSLSFQVSNRIGECIFGLLLAHFTKEIRSMKTYAKILFSILAAAICTSAFAAEPTPQSCKKSGKNCPMNDNKACNCGKKCSC
jgi:hypothetical protein